MTNETQQTDSTDIKPLPFGSRLKSARESLGFERKDVAAQLRLNEKIIIMMEKDRYPADLPVTFIRGYLRSYGKLLQIPEHEVKKAIEPIKPKPVLQSAISPITTSPPVTSGHYFMQFFTSLIMLTLVGLVGMWWYNHSTGSTPMLAENPLAITPPENINTEAVAAMAENTPPAVSTPAVATSAPPPPTALPVNASPPTAANTASQNNVDTSLKITNDTEKAAPKVAQSRKIVRAKRVVPVEEAEAQDLGPPQDGSYDTQTNS